MPFFQSSLHARAICGSGLSSTLWAFSAAAQNTAPGVLGTVRLQSSAPSRAETPVQALARQAAENEVQALYFNGAYQKARDKSSQALQSFPNDARLLYFRGCVAYALGAYEDAWRDMSDIRDFRVPAEFRPLDYWKDKNALDYVRKIAALKLLAPGTASDVRVGNRVVFQLHSEKQTTWSKAVIDLLPRAFEINRTFLGQDVAVMPVFLFSNPDHYARFQALRADNIVAGSWAWASGDTAGLYFGQGVGQAPPNVTSTYFRSTVVHELNHSFVRRLTDTASLPRWFEEGVAMTAGAILQTNENAAWEGAFQKALKADALLSLDEATQFVPFREAIERSLKNRATPNHLPRRST